VSCACRANPLQEQQAESVLIAWHLEAYPSICAAGCSASTLARMLPRRASPVLLSRCIPTGRRVLSFYQTGETNEVQKFLGIKWRYYRSDIPFQASVKSCTARIFLTTCVR